MKLKELLAKTFTIKPTEEKVSHEFAEFRATDVGEMINYVIVFSFLSLLMVGVVCIADPSVYNWINFSTKIAQLLVLIITWRIGKRFPTKISFTVAIGILIIHILTALLNELVVYTEETFDGPQMRYGGIFIYSLILAPSMKYMLFYIVVFYINIVQTRRRHQDEESFIYLPTWHFFTVLIFIFWFIFQKRELKRFY